MKTNLKRAAAFTAIMLLSVTTVFAYQVKDENADQFGEGTMDGTRVLENSLVLDYMSEDYDAPISLDGQVQRQMSPKIISDANGNLYTIYSENDGDGGGFDIWFAKSSNGGATWETKVQIDDIDEVCEGNSYDSIFPDIAIDMNLESPTIYVVWTDNRDPFGTCKPFYNNIWFSASKDYGVNWSENIMVNNYPTLSGIGGYGISYLLDHHEENTGGPKVAVSKSHEILVTWMSDELMPFDYDVYFSKADNNYPDYVFDADRSSYCNTNIEKVYERPGCDDAKVDDNTGNVYSGVPSIDVKTDSNSVVIAYEDDRDSTGMPKTNIYTAVFNEYGEFGSVFPTLGDELSPLSGAPYRIIQRSKRVDTDNANTSKNPDVEYGNNVYAAWEETGPDGISVNGQNIYMAYSSDGDSYSDPIPVNTASTSSNRMKKPDLLTVNGDDETIYLLYNETGSGLGILKFAVFDIVGELFFDLSEVAGGTGSVSALNGNVIFDDTTGMIYSVWVDYDASDTRQDGTIDEDVYSSRSYDNGATWGQIYPTPEDIKTFTSRELKMVSPGSFEGMKMKWNQDVSMGGEIKLQLRGSETKEGLALEEFVGPNNHPDFYYEYNPDGTYISAGLNGSEYLQYKVSFTPSTLRTVTPVLNSVEIHYGSYIEAGSCLVDSDCTEDEECIDELCIAQELLCGMDADCEEGFICNEHGYCSQEVVACETDEDCGEGLCLEGVCYTPQEPVEEEEEIVGEICGPFPDVSINDPNCPAIQFVFAEGIFEGYPDGTFGPDKVINRAETSKVILEAFNKGPFGDSGTNLGFPDVVTGAWYMSYIEKGVILGVLQGYPDGTFQPENQVNRVELLKIFFKTSEDELEECAIQPYNDTPLTEENSWFTPFVCFTNDYGLMDPDNENNFNPGDGMTRRDVAELFYRYDTVIGL